MIEGFLGTDSKRRHAIVLIGNVSQEPYCNNLLPVVAAFERVAEVQVLEPWKIPGFESTGGARPAPVPARALAALPGDLTPQIVVCLAGGLFIEQESRVTLPDGCLTIGLALSDPLGLEASLDIAPSFDLFYTQDPHALPFFTESGLNVGLCLPAVDPSVGCGIRGEPVCDVIFVGKWTEYRNRLVSNLANHCSIRVHTEAGETRWSVPAHPPLNTPHELAGAFARARLALEVARVEQEGNPLHGSHRITNRPQFAAVCGTPSLIEDYDELGRTFQPGREIATYSDERDLVETALELLGNDRRRTRMGRSAKRRVTRGHSWDRRVRMLLKDADRLLERR
jgi:hypothetical protein